MIVTILTAISGLFAAAGKLFEWLYARNLADAGRVQAKLESLQAEVRAAQVAVAAREAVRASITGNGLSVDERDPFLRD